MNTAAAIGTHPSDRVMPTSRGLMSPALVLVFLASVGGDVSFYLLLTVVPAQTPESVHEVVGDTRFHLWGRGNDLVEVLRKRAARLQVILDAIERRGSSSANRGGAKSAAAG